MITHSDKQMDEMGRNHTQGDLARMEINRRFGAYRPPTPTTIPKYKAIQEKTLELALLIHELCPESKEKATALTQLVGVKMSANAAVAIYSAQSEDCDAKATARNPSDSECATTRLD